ncbi:hypothetical protein M8J75_011566 [Diaphorina citri]|nr:hypothetical protein M8J75_011566 [Diaphorina citri]
MIHLILDLDYLATKLRKTRHHGSCSTRSGHFSAECLQETFQECTIRSQRNQPHSGEKYYIRSTRCQWLW